MQPYILLTICHTRAVNWDKVYIVTATINEGQLTGAQLANFVGGGEAPPSWGGARGGRNFFGKISVKLCILEHFKPGWEKTRNRAGAWTDYLQNCPRDFENCPRALIRRPDGPVLLEARGKNFFDFWTSLDAFIDHFLMIFSFFSSSTQFSFLS